MCQTLMKSIFKTVDFKKTVILKPDIDPAPKNAIPIGHLVILEVIKD